MSTLPPGWEKHLDEHSGHYYYYHTATQLTTWDPPTTRKHSSVSFGQRNSSGSVLPDGWARHLDVASGNAYYENNGGTTTWDKPSALQSIAKNKPHIALRDHKILKPTVGNEGEDYEGNDDFSGHAVGRPMSRMEALEIMHTNPAAKQKNYTMGKTHTNDKNHQIKNTSSYFKIFASLFVCLLLIGGITVGIFVAVGSRTSNSNGDASTATGDLLPTPTDGEVLVVSQTLTFAGVSASSLLTTDSQNILSVELAKCLEIKPATRVKIISVADGGLDEQNKYQTDVLFVVTVDPEKGEVDGEDVRSKMQGVQTLCSESLVTIVGIYLVGNNDPSGAIRKGGNGGSSSGSSGSGTGSGGTGSGSTGSGGTGSGGSGSGTGTGAGEDPTPPFSWTSCPTATAPTGQPPSYPRTLSSGNESPLPFSAETTILTLRRIKRDCTVEILAESYGGFGWHDLGSTSTVAYHNAQPNSPCTVKILPSEAGQYRVDAWMSTRRPLLNHTASRLMIQTTFGPTRKSIADYVNHHNGDPKMWLDAQMALPPTFLRSYYRQRTNPRMPVAIQSGTVRSACQVGSRWLTYSLTNADVGQTLKVYAGAVGGRTAGVFTLEIEGIKRTETTTFNGETFSSSSSDQTWFVCIVYENDRSEFHLLEQVAINPNEDCTKANNVMIINPPLNFATNDLTITRIFSADDVAMERVTPQQRKYVWRMAAMHGSCEDGDVHSQGGNTYMRIVDGPVAAFYRLDPRLKLLTNTIEKPADVDPNVDYASQCPLVTRSFVNGGSCVRRAATCSPLAFNERSITLNETTMRMWYTQSQRYVHYITGLRLENDYAVSPCEKGISRWSKLRDGVCRAVQEPATSLNSVTMTTIRAVLEASTDSTNPYVRDVNIDSSQLGDCTDANAVGATIEITRSGGGKECWRHVHPDTYSVYDSTIWTVIHDGNINAKQHKRPNPITAFATAGRVDIAFPSHHAMTRWKDRKKHFSFVGRLGDAVTFQSLPVEMQTLPLANYVGAVQTAPEGGFEACGSRAEYENQPSFGHHYPFSSKFNDLRNIYEEMDYPCNQRDAKSNIWVNVVLNSDDQLRQRVAWSLSQLIVISANDIGKDDESEPYVTFYDIFVEHAFGNYGDILREISFSPMMGLYLTFHQNKAFAFAGSYPDENYAREIMQLFTIGLWMLNNDGTRVEKSPGEYVSTYSNDDIMSFSRTWTGFDRQASRGNVESTSGENAANIFDSTNLKPEWRDQFPKTSLGDRYRKGGYLGDRYPLCYTDGNNKASWLRKGATFRYTGKDSTLGKTIDNEDSPWDRFTPATDSELYQQLCGPRGGDGKCTWPIEVILAQTLECKGSECDVERIRTIKMVDGGDIRWYDYIQRSCVTMTFFNGGVRTDGRWWNRLRYQCANPKSPVASPFCCDNSGTGGIEKKLSDAPAGMCKFKLEHTTLEEAKKRCKVQAGAHQCRAQSDSSNSRMKRRTCHPSEFFWSEIPCMIQVQIHSNGDINIVDSDVAPKRYGTERYQNVQEYALNNQNRFKVRWDGSESGYPKAFSPLPCGAQCEVGYANTCVCNTTVVDIAVFASIASIPSLKKDVLADLFIGSTSPSHLGASGGYTQCVTSECNAVISAVSNGITAMWYKQTPSGGSGTLDIDTIFLIESDIAGNPSHRLFNRMSSVSVDSSFSFRNPPKFMPMFGERTTGASGFPASLFKPEAENEVNALIQHLFEHPNTAPFVAHRLIQRMIKSNPTPRYVDVVATAFRTGSYGGKMYSGKYGDMKATTMAILLDREARAWVLDHDPKSGKIREPLLKVLHVLRSLEYKSHRGRDVFLRNLHEKIGQSAFNSPTVFSYFLPEYQPPGILLEKDLVAPEAQINTSPNIVSFLNGMNSLVEIGLSTCLSGFGDSVSRPARTCNTRTSTPNIRSTSDGTLTYTDSHGVDWLVHELNTLLTSGRLNEATQEMMKSQYNTILNEGTSSTNNILLDGSKAALKRVLSLFMLSSEFHTNTLNSWKTTVRNGGNDIDSLGRPFKAVIVLFLAGAADSFNMLVPHSECDPSHDLNAEYKQIRGTAALDKTELLVIENDLDGTSKAQPCAKFGMHFKMTAIHDAYNAGDAAWIANMGSLVEPVTKQEYQDKSKALPPSLFAHNVMQKSVATMHPQFSSASGILGRMTKSMTSQSVNPYRSALYSMAGVRSFLKSTYCLFFVCSGTFFSVSSLPAYVAHLFSLFFCPALFLFFFDLEKQEKIVQGGGEVNIISGKNGVVQFQAYDKFHASIDNLTKHESKSYMADTWSNSLRSSIESTEKLGEKLDAVTLDGATFGDSDIELQFKQIAKVIKMHRDSTIPLQERVERASFVAVKGGFDTHRDMLETLELRLTDINNALASFQQEMKNQSAWDEVVIVTVSDFGRTLTNNGLGTDHAWGGNYFVMGGDLKGKRIHGKYPAKLGEENGEVNIGRGRILPTTSYNSLWLPIAEWYGILPEELKNICPNYENFPNVLRKTDMFKAD